MATAAAGERSPSATAKPGMPLFVEGKCSFAVPFGKTATAYHSNDPLHIKTGWHWAKKGVDLMYHLTFEGHLYRAAKAIHVIAVGYLNESGHSYDSVKHSTDAVLVSTYQSTDGMLCFKVTSNAGIDWHASALKITLMKLATGYHLKAWTSIQILDMLHSATNF